jgi:hypothetical protein
MIKMIFEGGYVYNMAESEYKMLLTLAGLGAATVMGLVIAIGAFLTIKIRGILNR